jgi:antitoxin VapB
MALNLKNPEAARLARELARRCDQGITETVIIALREKLDRERAKRHPMLIEAQMRRIDEVVERFNRRPVRDDRSADEILGYNERGLFD